MMDVSVGTRFRGVGGAMFKIEDIIPHPYDRKNKLVIIRDEGIGKEFAVSLKLLSAMKLRI